MVICGEVRCILWSETERFAGRLGHENSINKILGLEGERWDHIVIVSDVYGQGGTVTARVESRLELSYGLDDVPDNLISGTPEERGAIDTPVIEHPA